MLAKFLAKDLPRQGGITISYHLHNPPNRPPTQTLFVHQANPGDTLRLERGEYWETVVTKTDGCVLFHSAFVLALFS